MNNKGLIRLRGCAGWSLSLLFTYSKKQVFIYTLQLDLRAAREISFVLIVLPSWNKVFIIIIIATVQSMVFYTFLPLFIVQHEKSSVDYTYFIYFPFFQTNFVQDDLKNQNSVAESWKQNLTQYFTRLNFLREVACIPSWLVPESCHKMHVNSNAKIDFKYELPHDKTNKMTCVPSEDSDQPGMTHSHYNSIHVQHIQNQFKRVTYLVRQTVFSSASLFCLESYHHTILLASSYYIRKWRIYHT